MAQFALLLTSTTIIVLAGFLLTSLMRPTSAGEVAVGTGSLSMALVAANSLVVGGLLQSYRPVPLLLGAVGLLVVTTSSLLGRQVRTAAVDSARLAGIATRDVIRLGPRHPVILILALAVLAAYGVRAYLSVRLPNIDWDGLYYHLVGIDEWIATERLGHSTLVLWADVYPQSVELFVAWTCVHLHNTVYAGVAQLPIFLVGAAAVAGLARRIGARRSHAALAGLMLLATPLVMAQFGTNYVDAGAASLGLAALYLVTGLRGAIDLDPSSRALWIGRLVTAGMVAGLACGAKSSNLLLAPFLVFYVLAVQWRTPSEPSMANRSMRWLRRGWSGPPGVVLFGLAALAIGGYWYVRTWMKYGSPLYPFEIAGFPGQFAVDVIIAPQVPPQIADHHAVLQVLMSWAADFHPFHTVDYGQRLGGMGMQWALILLPLAVVATVVWWREGRRGPAGLLLFILVCVTVTSPAPWWARYQLLNAGLAAALSAFAMTWLAQRFRDAAAVRTVASVALLAVIGTSMWWATRSLSYQVEGKADFLTLGESVDLATRDNRMDVVFPWFLYRPMKQVPRGASVAVLGHGGRLFTHPLFGNRYERDVVAVGAVISADQLADELRRRHLDYVVLDDDAAVLPEVLGDAARFRALSSNDQMGRAHLFQVGDFSEGGGS